MRLGEITEQWFLQLLSEPDMQFQDSNVYSLARHFTEIDNEGQVDWNKICKIMKNDAFKDFYVSSAQIYNGCHGKLGVFITLGAKTKSFSPLEPAVFRTEPL